MKEIAGVGVFISIASAVAGWLLPWWWAIAAIGCLIAFFCSSSAWRAFFAGACGVGLLWFGRASFIHWQTGGILTGKIAQIFYLPFPFLLVLVTALLGALVTGCACSAGFHLRRAICQKTVRKNCS